MRANKLSSYKVWVNKKHVGSLSVKNKDGVDSFYFSYNDKAKYHDIVSLTMPVRDYPYISRGQIHNVFAQNMPSRQVRAILHSWVNSRDTEDLSDWDVLRLIGENQIGRVSVTPESVNEIIDSPNLDFNTKEILRSKNTQAMFDQLLNNSIKSDSVGGCQPKVAGTIIDNMGIFHDGSNRTASLATSNRTVITSSVIVKSRSILNRHPFLCVNEYLCSLAARAAKIPTSIIRPNKDMSLNVIQRFDRKSQYGKNYRFGFDDGLSILPYTANVKHSIARYNSSYEKLADAFIKQLPLHSDHINLFKRIAMSIAISDGDAHLQNFGIIYNKNGRWLAPAYDISMTSIYYKKNPYDEETSPYDEPMALRLNDSLEYPDAGALFEFGVEYCNLSKEEASFALSEIQSSLERLRNGGVEKALSSKRFTIDESLIEIFDTSFNNLTMENVIPSPHKVAKVYSVPVSKKIDDVPMDIGL